MVKIGLEIHGYINTKEKLFCTCKAIYGAKHAKPNTNICPICTGQPGAKPMPPNKDAIDKSLKIAMILSCKTNTLSVWQRKHYSWPDLPKGYQNTISGPHAVPLGEGGVFQKIRIKECHLEEDPAAWNPVTGEIDYNRSGIPLIEIVTEPDFKNSNQVTHWLRELITTLSYIKTIDKKSGIKADVNISIGKGKRIEIKNVNSITNIKNAIESEISRQKKDLPKEQETRRYDTNKKTTIKMRSKEKTQDYRFVSDPDLQIIKISQKRKKDLEKSIPETPMEKLQKLIKKHKIPRKNAEILTKNIDIIELFEKVIKKVDSKLAIRWITEELFSVLNYNKKQLENIKLNPIHFIELLRLIEENKISELKAQEILRQWKDKSFSPLKNLKKHGKVSNRKEIEKLVNNAIKENKKAVQDYKSGKTWAINFLIGKIMEVTDKRADYNLTKKILIKKLN